jgi:hypothetical protein
MPNIILRPARPEDADYLVLNLREEDQRELEAGGGTKPLPARLHDTLLAAPKTSWSLTDGETLLGMGGFRPVTEKISLAWLLGTPELERYLLTFEKTVRKQIRRYFKRRPRCRELVNAVWAGNHKAVAWLEHLGAVFPYRFQPIGHNGELFHTFSIRRRWRF